VISVKSYVKTSCFWVSFFSSLSSHHCFFCPPPRMKLFKTQNTELLALLEERASTPQKRGSKTIGKKLCLWSWFLSNKIFYNFNINTEGSRLFRNQWLWGPCSIFFRNRHPGPLELVFSCFIQRPNRIFKNSQLKWARAQILTQTCIKGPLRIFHLPNGFLLLLSPWLVFSIILMKQC
jgi:hypothetical protein